jgi:dipeptidyl aminopeptidase/acylaminoacyl peptidase
MNADGTGQTNLTKNPATDGALTWSPDGTQIAFDSDRGGNTDVFVMNADGSAISNLTRNAAFDFDPIWSPDGAAIAFMSDRTGNTDVFVMNVDGSNPTNVTRSADSEAYGVSWQPLPGAVTHRWTLSDDFRIAPDQVNPNPDSYGNPWAWRFLKGRELHHPSTYRPMGNFVNAFGIVGLATWTGPFFAPDNLPAVGVNATGSDQFPLGWNWPDQAVLLHPYAGKAAVVGWRSPVNGTVRIDVTVSDLDPNCGDGIRWYVDRGPKTIASGRIANGGSGPSVSMQKVVHVGTNFYFIVDEGGSDDFYCDSTELALTIHD